MHGENGHRATGFEEAADGLPVAPQQEAETDRREHHEHRDSGDPHRRECEERRQIG
ncbi:hypothetical protein [Streptomyces sp. NPDC055107]